MAGAHAGARALGRARAGELDPGRGRPAHRALLARGALPPRARRTPCPRRLPLRRRAVGLLRRRVAPVPRARLRARPRHHRRVRRRLAAALSRSRAVLPEGRADHRRGGDRRGRPHRAASERAVSLPTRRAGPGEPADRGGSACAGPQPLPATPCHQPPGLARPVGVHRLQHLRRVCLRPRRQERSRHHGAAAPAPARAPAGAGDGGHPAAARRPPDHRGRGGAARGRGPGRVPRARGGAGRGGGPHAASAARVGPRAAQSRRGSRGPLSDAPLQRDHLRDLPDAAGQGRPVS